MSEPTGTQYGGFWARCIALLADSAILFLLSTMLLVGAAMALDPELLVPIALGLWLLGLLYWPVMHASRMQATLGKALVGLKVTRFDARRISILRSLWREIAKLFSAAVLMLGYIMAAFTPRKQALHDLMSATYVVHDGPARLLPALGVAVAGFAVPMVVGPMIVAGSVMSQMTGMAQGMLADHVPGMQQPLPPVAKAAPKPAPVAKAAPKPQPPAPVAEKKAPAPAPVAEQKAPVPAPVAEEKASAPAIPAPAPISIAAVAPAVEPDKPKVVTERKPKPAASKPPARVAKAPAPARASAPADLKRVSGPKYNDLMTAVLYRDAESVSELLKLGKWVDKPDSRGATPLMVAAELGDVRVAETLLRGGANAGLALRTAEERSDGAMLELLKRYGKR